MKTILFAVACMLAIGPAIAGQYGYRLGGSRLIGGNVAGGVRVVRPVGIGPRRMYVAPAPVAHRVNPYTGEKVVRKSSR
jgi:hypothetical protein